VRRRPRSSAPDSLVYGIHAVNHLLKVSADRVLELHVADDRSDQRLTALRELARQQGVDAVAANRRDLDHRTAGAHQGVVAVVRPRVAGNEDELEASLDSLVEPLLLVLDGVQDPHNLGACLRTADATGVDAVIAPRDRAAGLTGTVRKVASGATETVAFYQVTNLARTLRHLGDRGVRRIGADGEAETSLFAAELAGPLAIVMGGEGRGLRRLTRDHCDLLVSLPMLGAVESLNVSVATGVCLYTALARRTNGTGGRLASTEVLE
jgi:23S rRNA (guanosine2251-2'-O)-methyltransferase